MRRMDNIVSEKLPKRKSPRLKEYDYNDTAAYFITICVQHRKCLLSNVVGTGVLDCPRIELTEYGRIAEKYINQLNNFYENISVEQYVIMPNHIHMILFVRDGGSSRTPTPTDKPNAVVPAFVSTFKRFCNKEFGENIWQRYYYDHVIRNKRDYEKI